MRGRKLEVEGADALIPSLIKKESPNEGTETSSFPFILGKVRRIKKESPNEGTET